MDGLDRELHLVDAPGSTSGLVARSSVTAPRQARRISVRDRVTPSTVDVSQVLGEMAGYGSAVRQIPGLPIAPMWEQVAYLSPCRSTGAAWAGVYLFGLSVPGFSLTLEDERDNCYVYFAGASEQYGQAAAPATVLGEIVCPLWIEDSGHHVFALQGETYRNEYDPPQVTEIEMGIDGSFGASVVLAPDQPQTIPLLAILGAGEHQFQVRQLGPGGFLFQSVTVWRIPSIPTGPSEQ